MSPHLHELLTAEEIAERIQIEVTTIQKWARDGRIPVRRLSAKVHRYCLADVLASLESAARPDGATPADPARHDDKAEAFLRGLAVNTIDGLAVSNAGRKAVALQLRVYDPKLSIRQLAEMAGVDPRQIQRWLAGAKDATEGGEL